MRAERTAPSALSGCENPLDQDELIIVQDPQVKELVLRGVDIAKSAGASYADVRVSHTRRRRLFGGRRGIDESETLAAGVRVLYNGYWGFACSPIWSTEEMRRLADTAVLIARMNAEGKPRAVELAPYQPVQNGHWLMPIRLNPFDISPDEIQDFLTSLGTFMRRTAGITTNGGNCDFAEIQKAFGSTEGSYCTQVLYTGSGGLRFTYSQGKKRREGMVDLLTSAGMGWELFRDQPIREAFQQELEEIRFDMSLPVHPVSVGRYDTVLDAWSMCNIVARTIGDATLLTRAMGYNANDQGTSYVTDPVSMLGNYEVGNSLLTVSSNRDEVGGLFTVQWDDEGVQPVTNTLVKEGRLANFSTTRESATWLQSAPALAQQHSKSAGCANADSAIDVPVTLAGNLHLHPGEGEDDFMSLISNVTNGVAFRRMGIDMDFQCLNGFGMGKVYEVKNGKRVSLLTNAGTLLRTPEFWKSLQRLGGVQSARRFEGVTAVPALLKGMTIVDVLRKA